MFTATTLLDIAVEAETARNAIVGKVGISCAENDERYNLHRLADQALMCAEFMERHGIPSAKYVGPFGDLTFKAGDRVRVKKGAQIYTTNPKYPSRDGGKKAGVSHVVTASHVFEGWVGRENRFEGGIEVRQPQVHWAGQGGYWCWTDAENVEAVA